MFKIKGASSWAITRAEKLPDVTMMGINNLRRVVGYDFHHIRKKYDVPSMWGNIAHDGDFALLQRRKRGQVPLNR